MHAGEPALPASSTIVVLTPYLPNSTLVSGAWRLLALALAVGGGGLAHGAEEPAVEVGEIAVASLEGDGGNRLLGFTQQQGGALDAPFVEPGDKGGFPNPVEEPVEADLAHADMGGYLA